MHIHSRWLRWSLPLLCFAASFAGAQNGPDVTVFTLSGVSNYGAANGIRG